MANLLIITEPNEVLRKRSKEVVEFGPRLHEILDDMTETMREHNGAGIAAVQVGVLWRACVVDTSHGACELVNPVITDTKKPKKGEEGCLSIPAMHGSVLRPQEITVKARDRYGKIFERTFLGREAVCVCHEVDHLDGVLLLQRLDADQRKEALRELRRRAEGVSP